MKIFYVVSAVGRDRPGFVNRIVQPISQVGGNIELQRSVRMAGEYAALFLVSVDCAEADAVGIQQRLSDLTGDDLVIAVRDAVGGEGSWSPDARAFELIASGADQPGIIDAVTKVLFERQVNIESMDFDTEGAPMSGDLLFRMDAKVSLPSDASDEDVHEELKALEHSWNVDILFRPATG